MVLAPLWKGGILTLRRVDCTHHFAAFYVAFLAAQGGSECGPRTSLDNIETTDQTSKSGISCGSKAEPCFYLSKNATSIFTLQSKECSSLLSNEKSLSGLASGKASLAPDSSLGCSGLDCVSSQQSILDFSIHRRKLQDEILTKFQPKKKMSLFLADVYQALGLDSRAFRVADCGTFLEFHVTESDERLHSANFCKDRLCPTCNWRRSLKIFGQVSQVMDVLEHQDYRFLFLTLTVKNCSASDLPDTVQGLYDGWRMLYNKKSVFRRFVMGTFRSLEVTRNKKTGTFHPHLHVILAVRPDYFSGRNYLTQKRWATLWRSCCRLDYDPIVDIRTIKPGPDGLSGAVAEVSKYAVKDVDYLGGSMSDRMNFVSAFLSALAHRRLCSFTGCFNQVRKQLALDDVEDGDLVCVDSDKLRPDVAYLVVRYRWRAGAYWDTFQQVSPGDFYGTE